MAPEIDARGILVVDDEPQLLRLLGRVLERSGYHVLSAKDGDEALAVFEKSSDEIDVAVLDVLIPPQGVGEILPVMLSGRAELGVVLVSGDLLDDVVREQLDACRGTFLRKPFAPGALLRAVREVASSARNEP